MMIMRSRRLSAAAGDLSGALAIGATLRGALDRAVVGHDDAKRALVLALLAREHCYLEGAPGAAKTMLAERAAAAAGLATFTHQFHRDTRLADLVGDTALHRAPCAASGGEVVSARLRPGGVLACELAILDDVTRAPGEALNALLRVLNERRFESAGRNGGGGTGLS